MPALLSGGGGSHLYGAPYLATGVQGGEAGVAVDAPPDWDDEDGAGAGVVDVAVEVELMLLGDEDCVVVPRRLAVRDGESAERRDGVLGVARDVRVVHPRVGRG